MARRTSPFPKAGTICPTCEADWKEKNLPPVTLVNLTTRTIRHKHPIAVCPHCDGDVLAMKEVPKAA
jgi:hypothetical protein